MSIPEWRTESVETCLDRRASSAIKLQTKDYKNQGKYPIVDQGQDLIAGWTDDESGLISEKRPIIVFGDHTRAFKFVDFPFVRGADGTQLLRPKESVDPRYFFYACRALDLPSRGYNRHFSILKEKAIPLPPFDEQVEIGRTLAGVEQAIELQNSQLIMAGRLKRATMRELFARGLRGETQKETEISLVPESWEIRALGTLCERSDTVDLRHEGERVIEYVDVSSVSREALDIESTSRFTLKDAPSRARKRILTGDVIFATVRPTLLRTAYVTSALNNQVCSTAFCVLRRKPKDTADKFIFYLVQREQFTEQLARIESGASYPAVTDRNVMEQAVPVPDLDEQREIVAILDAIDRKIDLHKRKRAVLDELFKALLQKLMTGEVRVADLDLSALGVAA